MALLFKKQERYESTWGEHRAFSCGNLAINSPGRNEALLNLAKFTPSDVDASTEKAVRVTSSECQCEMGRRCATPLFLRNPQQLSESAKKHGKSLEIGEVRRSR